MVEHRVNSGSETRGIPGESGPFPGSVGPPPAYRFSLCGGGYNASRLNDREGVEHIPYYAYRLRTTEGSDIERENVRGGWDR